MSDPIDLTVQPVPVEEQPHQDGHKVWPTAFGLDPTEKALLLVERNEQSPGSRGFRRYQTIFVNRGDRLAKWMGDMGEEVIFATGPFSIPGGDPGKPESEWFATVGELKEQANEMRQHLLEKLLKEGKLQAPPLIEMYADEIEQRDWVRKGKRVYGPNVPNVHWSRR
tara:strand:+ start:3530 stop:4030 length:501 start_codon:yes stop_codon:yes gene_type:complete